jgi:hypothetical protein
MNQSSGPSSDPPAGRLSEWIVAAQARRREQQHALRRQRPPRPHAIRRRARKRLVRAAAIYGMGLVLMVVVLLVALSRH